MQGKVVAEVRFPKAHVISESRNRKTPQKNLRPATFTKLAVGLRRLLNISNVRQIPKQHLSDPIDPVADTEEPEPETRVPDTIMMDHTFDTIHSTIDAQFKFSSRPETPMVPFTILSLPSSEKLADPSRVSLGKDLLGPDDSFRSTGLATDPTHGLGDAP